MSKRESQAPSEGSNGAEFPPARATGCSRRWFNNPWFLAALAGVVLIPAMRPLLRFEPAPPPVLRQLPEWQLVDQHGKAFGSGDLAGEVYVASFFFTRCATVCPRLTAAARRLERRFQGEGVEARLVGFSVDPEHDTPQRLRDYAASRGLPPDSFRLVTGDEDAMRSLVVSGFALPMGERLDLAGGLVDVAHAAQLVLVDRGGGVRGHYGTDEVGLDEVFHRARHVAAERVAGP